VSLMGKSNPPAYSDEGFQPERRRRYGDEPVNVVKSTREKPTTAPSSVELLATLVEQVAELQRAQVAAEQAAAACEAREVARHAAVMGAFEDLKH